VGTRNVYIVEKNGAEAPEFVALVESISPASAISFCTKPVYSARLVSARELANMLLAHDKVEIKQDNRKDPAAPAPAA
jgi:hypothetical protein